MDILPLSSHAVMSQESAGLDTLRPDREEWKRNLKNHSADEWCIFTVNVRNTYGIPFEVMFEHHGGMSLLYLLPRRYSNFSQMLIKNLQQD